MALLAAIGLTGGAALASRRRVQLNRELDTAADVDAPPAGLQFTHVERTPYVSMKGRANSTLIQNKQYKRVFETKGIYGLKVYNIELNNGTFMRTYRMPDS